MSAPALRYHRAMLDDADNDPPEFDPPDADLVYERYLKTCQRLAVEPVPRDRAQDLMAEWSAALAIDVESTVRGATIFRAPGGPLARMGTK
jgi:hypothetical protein